MIRVVTFDPQNERDRVLFQLTYEGFVLGGMVLSNLDQKADFAKVRLEAKLARKLGAISEESSSDSKLLPSGKKRRGLTDGGPVVTLRLEQVELDGLTKRLEAVPWHPDFAVDAVDAVDHLAAAAKADEEP